MSPATHDDASLPPDHYRQGATDLYAHFIAAFGFDVWAQHAELECIQYLWRCRRKGQYAEDIRKVLVICQRILDELAADRSGQEG